MDRQAFFDDLQHRVLGLLRSGPATDLERNLKALLGQAFQRLELVTREEFELQRELLSRTREKLDALEKQVHQFEARQARTPSAGGESPQDSSHPPSHPPSH